MSKAVREWVFLFGTQELPKLTKNCEEQNKLAVKNLDAYKNAKL